MVEDLIRLCEGITKRIDITYNEIDNSYIIIAYDYLWNVFLRFPFNPYVKKIENILIEKDKST